MALMDRIAIVTGAGRGIGKATALALAQSGAHVAAVDIDQAAAEATAGAVAALGRKSLAVVADMGDLAGIDGMVRRVADAFGHIDILVNNAGVTEDDLFIRMKPDAWTNVMRTNLDSAFHITQEVVKKMIRARWGRVINISSVVGLMGNAGQVNYASSKAAMIGFTKSLALEIGSRNVTVNAVAPGFITTAMTDQMTVEARSALEGRIALKRLGVVDDVAYAVVFLASEQASYITGTVLNVSGGLYT